jgi:lysylphosphatidylglycerol synthetase-like protein (DUF2156 family)
MDRNKFRLAMVPLMLLAFYSMGFPREYLVLLGIILILLVLFRDAFYRKIDGFLTSMIPSLERLPSWARKLILIAIFILAYFLLKQVLFISLKLAGFDIERILADAINRTVG